MSCSHNRDKLSKYSTVSHISSTGWLNRLIHPSVTLKKTDKSFPAKSSQGSSLLLQTCFFVLWPNNSILVYFDHKNLFPDEIWLEMWAAANFSQTWRCWLWSSAFILGQQRCIAVFTMNSKTGVPAVIHRWHAWGLMVPGFFLKIIPSFLSFEDDNLSLPRDLDKVSM